MAFRRSLTTRATLFTRWYHPSVSQVVHQNRRDDDTQSPIQSPQQLLTNYFAHEHIGNRSSSRNGGMGTLLQSCSSLSVASGVGLSSYRYMSSEVEKLHDDVSYMTDATETLMENSMEVVTAQAPAVNEVAIAAADSAYPVAALQYLIDGVHSFTGLNWWAAIALTTVLIRGATLPLLINQLKVTTKLNMIRPQLEEIKQQVQASGMDPTIVAQGQRRMNALFMEHGVGPFTPFKGLLIQVPIFVSFFFAIMNMVDKVPSMKVGGAFWFTDLTTPDHLYIFPVLASLSFLVTVECNVQEGLEGNPVAGNMKNLSRFLAILAVPFTMGFPKALFCYWITSNLFSFTYGIALKQPQVRKFLELPDIGLPTGSSPSTFSIESSIQQFKASEEEPKQSQEPSRGAARKISPRSVLNQRIRMLEKQVKGGKKNNKL